jgi:hypothetical protein
LGLSRLGLSCLGLGRLVIHDVAAIDSTTTA